MPEILKRSQPANRPEESGQNVPDAAKLIKLFDTWMQGDETEQKETFEFLRRSLDEHRPAGYKFFS